jgi:hypothetical protein
MSDSEDEAVERQLKIVIVGEAGCGKVKNLGLLDFLREAVSAVHALYESNFKRSRPSATAYLLLQGHAGIQCFWVGFLGSVAY